MNCPYCNSPLLISLSCPCNEFDCADRYIKLFECAECQQTFNLRV